jgi:orotidine-5'-phosphate decarboxylase
MSLFVDKCIDNIKHKKSNIIVGLDPHLELFPQYLLERINSIEDVGNIIFEFNKKIVDAVYDLAPIIKPQIAFYEQFGLYGIKAYHDTIKYGQEKGMLVIGDIKRGDIGSTAKAYSKGHIGKVEIKGKSYEIFGVDAVTLNPYLGSDSIRPFLIDAENNNKGLFILVKTSNPSSGEFQDLIVEGKDGNRRKLYEEVANYVKIWGENLIGVNGYSSVGAVVGATYPEELAEIRKLLPNTYFLIPGYGAQGGGAEDIKYGFNPDGLGALVNASRSIIFAYRKSDKYNQKDFDKASREEVIRMNKEINSIIK